jgi:hypothetical protein
VTHVEDSIENLISTVRLVWRRGSLVYRINATIVYRINKIKAVSRSIVAICCTGCNTGTYGTK